MSSSGSGNKNTQNDEMTRDFCDADDAVNYIAFRILILIYLIISHFIPHLIQFRCCVTAGSGYNVTWIKFSA